MSVLMGPLVLQKAVFGQWWLSCGQYPPLCTEARNSLWLKAMALAHFTRESLFSRLC